MQYRPVGTTSILDRGKHPDKHGWGIHPPERISQEVELPFRYLADPCLLLVHRQLQLAHDLAQVVQRRFGVAPPAQDHEVVGIDDKASAEAALKAELLPPQHEPAHVD